MFDPKISEYGYIVFLNTKDEVIVNDVINLLDDYIISYRNIKKMHIRYSIYIVENTKLYKDILNTNFDLLKPDGGVSLYPIDLFDLIGYKSLRIGYNEKFGQDIFSLVDDSIVDEKVLNYYDDIIFWYYAEPNSFVGGDRPYFYVFGIK